MADEMGMGKTMVMLAAMLVNQTGPTLVVCPLSLLSVWEEHLKDYAPSLSVHA